MNNFDSSLPQESPSPAARHLRWEARWIPVEMAVVALALYLTQASNFSGFGDLLFLIFLPADLAIRVRHYWTR